MYLMRSAHAGAFISLCHFSHVQIADKEFLPIAPSMSSVQVSATVPVKKCKVFCTILTTLYVYVHVTFNLNFRVGVVY